MRKYTPFPAPCQSRESRVESPAKVSHLLSLVSRLSSLVFFLLFVSLSSAEEATVVNGKGQVAGMVAMRKIKTIPYLRARDMIRTVGGSFSRAETPAKAILSLGEHRLIITADSRAVTIDGTTVLMPVVARTIAGALYVPATSFVPILNRITVGKQFTWNAPKRTISIGSVPATAEPVMRQSTLTDRQWMIDTIVIDPGHGGHDTGAIGPTGLKEKNVALDIAKRLGRRLAGELGVKTVLTRTSDVFVGLKERSRVASKKAGGKLFISIHCNANRDPQAEGCEVYFLSEARTDDARDVAMRENASFIVETKGKKDKDISNLVGEILLGLESDQYLKESQDLAAMVVEEVLRETPLKSRGVKQAGFYVMKGTLATMPSILVETAFISNPHEERLLRDPTFREQVVSSIVKAVGTFKHKYENGLAQR